LELEGQCQKIFCDKNLDNNFSPAQSRINESNRHRGSRRESAVAQLFSLGGFAYENTRHIIPMPVGI